MSIIFKARVLLELGAELISSDAVALYELVKNGLDAGSKAIQIDIQVVLQPSAHRRLSAKYGAGSKIPWVQESFLQDVADSLDIEAAEQQKAAFQTAVGLPLSREDAMRRLDAAVLSFNWVVVRDYGTGMSLDTLRSCYLTIGTPVRLHERERLTAKLRSSKKPLDDAHIPLGEKGIGRLAAMRIGHHVSVETGVHNELKWNELILDWRPIFEQPDLDASALNFDPKRSNKAKSLKAKGTTIVISDLQSDWTSGKVAELGKSEFAKLRDPFKNNYANQFLTISWQGKNQEDMIMFQSSLLEHADAKCSITYRVGNRDISDSVNGPRLEVATNYKTYNKAQSVTHDGVHLSTSVSHEPKGKRRPRAIDRLPGSDEVIEALATLGDFDAEFHWFNRGRFMRDESELWESKLKLFVRSWSGGLLVYRDGFRVYPYGAPSDDWLDLDRKALSSGAYKLNRAQIVGYLRISSRVNPRLQDQTNREGFRDCPEKEALRRLLRQAIVSDCKTFLESVDKQNKPADEDTIKDLQRRIDLNQRSASNTLKQLKLRVPDEAETVNKVIAQLREVEDAWGRAKEALAAHEEEIERYIHLAGVGLMVELIAHELARTTQSALELLSKKSLAKNPHQLAALEAQIKTLNKRVRVLDELSIPGRQIKAIHDMSDLVDLIIELYDAKAKRHGVLIEPKTIGKGKFKQRIEKGQILQILDNLMSNSMYWLARRADRETSPKITIEVDVEDREIRLYDNGPGVPVSTGHKVFEAFYTTKPSGDGRGLGLYIAKRLAEENGAKLELLDTEGRDHHGFVLAFQGG
jgi:signal transduction histidine kinase